MPGSLVSGRGRGRPHDAKPHDPMLELPISKNKLAERLATPVEPLKQQKRSLTAQEWNFVQELVAGEGSVTLKEAAIRAGYPEKKAPNIANTLTNPAKNPHVVAAIQEYRKELAQKYGTNYERHMRDLMIIRDKALEAGNFGAAVTAEYRRGQALGSIYIDRKEIRHGTIDSMSKEEVMRKLEEIKRVYGGPAAAGPIEDIQAREVVEDETRSEAPQEDEDGHATGACDANREQGGAGDTGLPGGFVFEVPDGGAESSEQREKD